MDSTVGITLIITLVGMSLVFAAIAAFWGLMVVLVKLTSRGRATGGLEAGPVAANSVLSAEAREQELRQRAAIAAVAVALACEPEEGPQPFPVPPTALVSTWQAVLRARQLGQRGPVR